MGGSYRLVGAYNRRIDRPGEPELRIFPKYNDPELLKVGNPYLRPQLTNVFELGLTRSWNGRSVGTSAYHRDITDAFQRILVIDNSNPNYDIVNKIYENAGNSTQTGIQTVFEQEIAAPWRVSGSVNWFVIDIEELATTLLFPTPRPFSLAASRDDTWDFTVNNQFQLPGKRGATARLHLLRSSRRAPGQGALTLLARSGRHVAPHGRAGRRRVHVHGRAQRLRRANRRRGAGIHGPLRELPGDAGGDGGASDAAFERAPFR